MAVALAVAFSSCDGKKSSKSDNSDDGSSGSKRTEKAELSGDVSDDAEALVEKALDIYEGIESVDDLEDAIKDVKKMAK